MELAIGILLLAMSVFLVVAVLLQSGKDKKLSGTIAGGADTFFGKGKGAKADRLLNTLTVTVSVVFALLVVVLYLIAG